MNLVNRERTVNPLTALVASAGIVCCLFSFERLSFDRLNWTWLILSLVTTFFGSRLTIQIPRAKAHVSVSDSLIFLILLLYGTEAAVLVSAIEAFYTSLRFKKKGITIRLDGILFNSGLMACSTFATGSTLLFLFGAPDKLKEIHSFSLFATALAVMALTQYFVNTLLAAVYTAGQTQSSLLQTWWNHYSPASITYLAGAAAAGLLVRIFGAAGFFPLLVLTPVTALVYFTHRRYVDDIKASATQAEQAERARAESAERHVEELNHYIEELKRIGNELTESKEHFRHAAFHDLLTGLPNRALFTERLKFLTGREQQEAGQDLFAVLFLDLDRFKNINDSLGHAYGDQLLVATAQRLRACLGRKDMVARFGGDEFAILLEGIREAGEAVRVAERIQSELSAPLHLGNQEAFTTASIGIALSSTGYVHPDEVLRDADTAMYRAKEGGKARHEMFDKMMHARALSLMQLETDLRRAVEREEFLVHYQPVVSLETGVLTGFEALVRWRHPERGLISPAEFIPVAEDTGLIIAVGEYVLREACRQICSWQQQELISSNLTLSVNLSGRQLTQPNLIEQVTRILRETEFHPQCLKLEITESVVMENAELAARMLAQLRALGLQLSIDDFGTGYSSLSYLHRFPVNILKVDRSFVSRINSGDENLEIVRTIVSLAHNLDMEVVAEGIETSAQLEQLKMLGCEYGQGYLFSKPLAAAATETMLVERRKDILEPTHLAETQFQDVCWPATSELIM